MKSGTRFALIAVLVLGGVGTITYLNRVRSGGGQLVQQVKRTENPVRVLAVKPRAITEAIEHTGVLAARRDVTLTAEVGGKVLRRLREMGQPCRKGQVIVQLDAESYRIADAEAQAHLEQSRLQRAQADRDLKRTATLARRKVVAAENLDRAQTALKVAGAAVQRAEAALQLARRNLRETRVRCPFDGTVAEISAEMGQIVAPQTPLARLVDDRELKLKIEVSASELARLEVGQPVRLRDPAIAEERAFSGKIARLGVAADATTRTFPVEVVVPGGAEDRAGALRPGQVVRATITIAEHAAALAVPESAVVVAASGEASVLVAEGKRVARRAVTLGSRVRDQVIVTSGLSAGEQLIVSGQHGLQPGDVVAPQAASPSASPSAADAAAPPRAAAGGEPPRAAR